MVHKRDDVVGLERELTLGHDAAGDLDLAHSLLGDGEHLLDLGQI